MLRIIESDGAVAAEFPASRYLEHIGEATKDFTYLKFPYILQEGQEMGIYRVGPLARLNIAECVKTPRAGKELGEFKALGNGQLVNRTLYYHYARIIELMYAVERAGELLQDDIIVSKEIRVPVQRQEGKAWKPPGGL